MTALKAGRKVAESMALKAKKILILFSFLLCAVLFLHFMADAIDKYSRKMTNIGVVIREHPYMEKPLPCITICPWRAFKHPGFHFNLENFAQNTFEKEDIFLYSAKYNAFNKTLYAVKEIRSPFFGRCYVVNFLKPQQKKETTHLVLKNSMDYKGTLFKLIS